MTIYAIVKHFKYENDKIVSNFYINRDLAVLKLEEYKNSRDCYDIEEYKLIGDELNVENTSV